MTTPTDSSTPELTTTNKEILTESVTKPFTKTRVDCSESVNEYVSKTDWRINANANAGYSHAGLINSLAGKVIANFWLDDVYTPEEGTAHREGAYHIHDLDLLAGYCLFSSTKIKTEEYGDIEIGKLAEFGPENKFTVLSKTETGKTIQTPAFNARKTGIDRELIEITFEDGLSVKCTPDHQIMLTDGSYKEAKDLTPDDDIATA
jgi:hypothetical protein